MCDPEDLCTRNTFSVHAFHQPLFDAADMFVPFDHPVRWKGLGCERQTLHVKNGFEPERVFVMTMAASREWDV